MFITHSMVRRTVTLVVSALTCAFLVRGLGAQAGTAVASPAPARIAIADSGRLTLERIYSSNEFETQGDPSLRWTDDGKGYTALEPAPGARGGRDLVRYDAASGKRTLVVPASSLVPPGDSTPIEIEDYQISRDGRRVLFFTNARRVWRMYTRGDYWTFDLTSGSLRKLGGAAAAPSTLMFAKFSPDGARVAYVRANNLYVEDLATGAITPLTTDGSRTIINGTFDWVYEEELNLRDGFRWSPDGRRIAYWQLNDAGVRDYLLLDTTDSLYSFTIPIQYPKAGTTNSAARVGVVSASGGATQWIAVPGDPREHYIARLEWAANSDEVVLEQLDRRQHTLLVMLGDARTGAARTVLSEKDSTWVEVVDDLRWVESGRRFTWVSERDGWRRLYSVSRDGASIRPITNGAFDLQNPAAAFGEPFVVGVDSAAGWIYFTASPDAPTQLYLYRSRLDGRGRAERVTPAGQTGTNLYSVAPGGRMALHIHSTFTSPPTYEIVRLPSHATVRVVADNGQVRARLAQLQRGEAKFMRVPTRDGVPLDAWVMTPPGFDPGRKYPVLFYVYGEPAGQTVLDQWTDDYLWRLMLTQHGYIVASIDNRGAPAPRGRAWRRSIYGAIGVLASQDQADGARALAKELPYIDSTRIGVWGWSGGGSMTLNLMFRSPELYKVGMAVAPMPDERLYDTIYEERYMGLPSENAEGYRRGSPLTYAANLRGDLLVAHGTGDDNVHYQGTERLINALVAANRPFTMMAYPNRSHCICEGPGTTLHLFGVLTRYLEAHLAAGPAAQTGTGTH
ncbi:MAG TPA: S9 family peptidase [Gemmatimonadaceae bacterium]|nr:S9 family peptidase [Gemmatimonadaceae bacterium]